ncbi:MAG: DUF4886 domain-containing protein [Alistipes sp.]
MRKLLFFSWIFALCLSLSTAVYGIERNDILNNPLPESPDTLRILGVGNSFTDDGMMYLPDLLRAAGIENVVLARLYFPGCSLEQHCHFEEEQAKKYIYYKSTANAWTTVSEQATLREALLDERWDVVVVQQASHFSGQYATYTPWLNKLIDIILDYNTNPHLSLAWQMTWAYSTDATHDGFARYGCSQQQMYDAIADATQQMQAKEGIKVLIPSGVAIQNARKMHIVSQRDMTRDGYHLDLGVGRYTAACTWFEALIAPTLGVSVRGNAFRIPCAAIETTPVTDANARRCQRAAVKAVK